MIIERKEYLEKLIAWKDKQLIKIVQVYDVVENLCFWKFIALI